MPTEVLHVEDRAALSEELSRAGAILRRGGLVAFPTETVYGIAVSAKHPESVERLYAIKGRPRTKPMTMMVADVGPVLEQCPDISPRARALMRRYWPGPLTLVLPDKDGRKTGFRLPAHPLARGLVREAGLPLYVPSANRSGEPPATRASEVLEQFPTELDLVIDGGPAEGGIASTVIQILADEVTVLREGAIPESRLLSNGAATILFVCSGNTDRSPLAAAILRRKLARHLRVEESELAEAGYEVVSAGTTAKPGRPASLNVRRIARDWTDGPLDLDRHRSVELTSKLIEKASRIYCMERGHREQILAFFPHRDLDVLLVDPEAGDIEDPAGQRYEVFQRLARRLDAAATLITWSLIKTPA